MSFKNVLHDSKSEAGTTLLAAPALVDTIKPFKDTVEMSGWNSLAVVRHKCCYVLLSNVELDRYKTTFGSVVDRVRNEVGDHLRDPLAVGIHDDAVMIVAERKPDLFLFSFFFELVQNIQA